MNNIPQQFIDDIYCHLGFMPLPSQLRYLYEIQKNIDANYSIDDMKKKSKYLKDLYLLYKLSL